MHAVIRLASGAILHAALLPLVLIFLAVAPRASHAADDLKAQALARLAASHDPAIPIAVGRVYVKQRSLLALRRMLADAGATLGAGVQWRPGDAHWQAAEQALVPAIDAAIASGIEDPAWFRAAWGDAAGRVLNAEEADEIATHFASDGGRQQRAVLELLLVGETLIANYTFTGRIRYDVPGAENEMRALQKTWWVEDHRRIYDFTPYPNAMRFASQDPGVKYSKMLAIQGIDALNAHFDRVALDIERGLAARCPDLIPFVERCKAEHIGSAQPGASNR